MISRVVFEAPEDEAALVPHAGIGEAMEMLCTRNERVVVAVFHESRGAFADEDDEEAREVHVAMRQLVEQARELWSPDVSRADFKTTVDRLCARIVGLPPPPPDPRQPSPPPRPARARVRIVAMESLPPSSSHSARRRRRARESRADYFRARPPTRGPECVTRGA